MATNTDYSLMVHGGAGTLDDLDLPATARPYGAAIEAVLEHGRTLLAAGRPALDVVESCAVMLEDDALFNAGRGSVLNEEGQAEMDAAIMDGRDLAAGAVAVVRNIANPIRLARLVMQHSDHVLLAGEGARRFAERHAVPSVPDAYFQLPSRVEQLRRVRRAGGLANERGDAPRGTIGAIARDLDGHLAAATSTGGMVNKAVGRIGDSPIIGAGVYADDASCAVSSTGHGEDFMRCVFAKTIADMIEIVGMDASAAMQAGIDYLARKLDGRGGAILIDRTGRCACGHTTRHMIRGWIEHGGAAEVRF